MRSVLMWMEWEGEKEKECVKRAVKEREKDEWRGSGERMKSESMCDDVQEIIDM